jgi:hypothetical protein
VLIGDVFVFFVISWLGFGFDDDFERNCGELNDARMNSPLAKLEQPIDRKFLPTRKKK